MCAFKSLVLVLLLVQFVVTSSPESAPFCSTKLITLDGGLSEAQDNPCFMQINVSPSHNTEYHSIFCQSPSLESLKITFHNYVVQNCSRPIVLHLYALSFPLNASIFAGLEDRLRVLTVKQWTPETFFEPCESTKEPCKISDLGEPFRYLRNLEVLYLCLKFAQYSITEGKTDRIDPGYCTLNENLFFSKRLLSRAERPFKARI